MRDYTVEWRSLPTALQAPRESPRMDVKGTCQLCGASYDACGSRKFVDEFVADFNERHEHKEGT